MNPKTGDSADQVADRNYRNSDVGYVAHCRGIVELTFKDGKHSIAPTGIIMNSSVTGCLFTNDKMPWANIDAEKFPILIFEILNETCRLYIPWINIHSAAKIRRVGSFTIGIEFDEALKEILVRSVASLELNQKRRFKPIIAAKYNRVLPIADKLPVT